LNIINPNFKINEDDSIFKLRREEYNTILEKVTEIVHPVEDIGFTVTTVDLKDSKFSSGELSKTIKQKLVIRLQKGTSEIDISMIIPELIDNNYIMINGRKKIPLFQLFDVPVVTRGESIKLRTNVATIMIFKDKEAPFVKVSFMSKKVSLALLMYASYTIEELVERFDLTNIEPNENSSDLYECFLYDLKLYYDESRDYTQDNFILEVGGIYSKYNKRSKGEDIVYALDLITKVDIMSAKFFQTDSVLNELIFSLNHDIDDTQFINKRIRCFEYMILGKVSKAIFDLCVSCRVARQPKFNVNSTHILTECNVSDIVQFDFSINPIEELTKLSRISLLGPGGFKRENVPKHLRDIHPSMFGRICPVDTPDRDNCGILQNLVPNVKVDENMKFTDEINERQPISIPVSMIPFLQNDDQTRLQMASSQMRQAIMLKKFDTPLISSGCEGLYTDHTQFVKRAKRGGEVLYVGGEYIIVVYDNEEAEIFDISHRNIYVDNMDFMNIYVTQGDKFHQGDILAESNYCKNGKINIGKNLLTGIMSHYGNNYEDGIIISKRLVDEGIFTSVHNKDLSFILPPSKVLLPLPTENGEYAPLPKRLERVKTGDPYAIIKEMNSYDFNLIFGEEITLKATHDFIISDVKIYPNDWNDDIPEYQEWVEAQIEKQQSEEKAFQKIITDAIPKEAAEKFITDNSLNKFSYIGKFKNKGERINGMRIELSGVYFRNIKVGDKIANRHGNKGVISRIIEHDKMPKIEDGRNVDICINPLGIISRMNIGQLFELHLAESFCNLKKMLKDMVDEKIDQAHIKAIFMEYINVVDNTRDGWYTQQASENLPEKIDKEFINNMTLIQAPFESVTFDQLKKALDFTQTKFKQKVYDPLSKTNIVKDVAVGKIYFFRMVHIADEKIAARGIGAYSRRTLQPLGGRKNKGGQRCGEMETACLIGHDAPENLFEFFTTKSDCIDLKNKYIKKYVDTDLIEIPEDEDEKPESNKLLDAYFKVVGVDID